MRSGPFDGPAIRTLIDRGEVTKRTKVWQEGYVEWVSASEIPGLFAGDPQLGGSERSSGSSDTISERDTWKSIRRLVLERDGYRCMTCGDSCRSEEADIHHLMPRSLGGSDEPSNLITLCDGCHAAHHPSLQTTLSRRLIERWGVRLARWLDRDLALLPEAERLGPALRLFGISRFRDGQLDVILAALRGQSLLMISPTGSGKTLCFQLPALLKPGVAFVISPLKALMSDQVSALQRKKLPGTYVNGDLNQDEKATRYDLLKKGALKFLYCTPERFDVRDRDEVGRLLNTRPNFLVVDEAHCIDRWGKDFRPHYGNLGAIRGGLGSPPVLAFTASAGVETQKRILASLKAPDAKVFVRGVDRPNIAFLRVPMTESRRHEAIAELLNISRGGRAMIFVPTIKKGNTLQKALAQLGQEVPFYHSQLSDSWERETLTKRFLGEMKPEISSIICTNAFGMGLDVPDVRMVIHWQQTASVEDYLQEFGRSGRDGKPALAVLFVDSADTGILQFMAKKTVEQAKLSARDAELAIGAKLKAIDEMRALATSSICFRRQLISYFESNPRPTRRSLGRRIVEWIFSNQGSPKKSALCCDACAGRPISDFRRFSTAVLSGAA